MSEDKEPWKWQLIDRLDRVIKLLEQKQNKSAAGRASVEARREKFGTAVPPRKELGAVIEINPVREQKPKKRIATDGSVIFQSYATAYQNRYGVPPLRNAKVNGQCSQIAKQVGVERGSQLVGYYLTRSDMMYLKSSHPIGLCLLDLQKLATQSETNTMVSHKDAQRAELEHANNRAIEQYLSKQNPVREREVENADS